MVDPEERTKVAVLITVNAGLLIALFLAAVTKINLHVEIHIEANETEPETSTLISDVGEPWFDVLKNPLPFEEAVEHCQLSNKKLPTPTSQEEEDKLVEELVKLNYSSENCAAYYLGYKANLAKRYIKLSEHIHLPSLEIHADVAKPTINDKCIGVQRDLCIDFVPCQNISGQCFLKSFILDDKKNCVNDIYAEVCWELDVTDTVMSPIDYTNNLKNKFGLLPLNEKLPSAVKDLLKSKARHQCPGNYLAIGVGVATELEYYNVFNRPETMNYKSNRFVITDSNYNCLALNARDEYKLTTESCFRPACVICV